ncbi:MAG: hypothetical protein ACRC6M_03300 [Microcystaceae cyanobacterium]
MKCLILESLLDSYLVENIDTKERSPLSKDLFRRSSPIVGKKYEIDVRGNNAFISPINDEAIAAEIAIIEANQVLMSQMPFVSPPPL